ncbi:MAG: DNA internalization-related competence protein ComEC/Rec2 [Zoogloeaceae bacterium]|jgi:competence protein ComEC|nr:DNA internalization-related competence protein ComEC/Rec2 [Zoogloeaceae bacterium]
MTEDKNGETKTRAANPLPPMRCFPVFLLAFALGVCLLQTRTDLPQAAWIWILAGLCGFLVAASPVRVRAFFRAGAFLLAFCAGIMTGYGWAAWRAESRLADALPATWEGEDVRVAGVVVSLPARFDRGVRFVFQVEAVLTPEAQVPARLWLNFYTRGWRERDINPYPPPRAGERHEFTVRLKRPHGRMNPHGMDYEVWLLERNLRATGYVRNDPAPVFRGMSAWPPMTVVHRLRETARDHFLQTLEGKPYGGILTALAIGDQDSIPRAQWNVFNRTGTTHLMSISGLHVTLVAMLTGWLLNGLWRRLPRLCLLLPAQRLAILGGALAAVCYALLSGLNVPAQRATLMLLFVAIALLLERRIGLGRILLLALIGVLLFDPWAVLASGFWLSFCTVAAICWVGLHAWRGKPSSTEGNTGKSWEKKPLRQRLGDWIVAFARAQWAAMLATLPLLFFFFQRFPLNSPLANLLAIPWISFVITPLCLLGALLSGIFPPLLEWTHLLLTPLMALLKYFADGPLGFTWQAPAPSLWRVALAGCGVLLLLMPRGLPGKGAALVMFLPLLFTPAPQVAPGNIRLSVLDVGQGQAALLETAQHRLLYDAGPGYGPVAADSQAQAEEGRDAGTQIILPYLAARGIAKLDALVVSHRDNDHSGGMAAVRAGVKVEKLISSVPEWTEGELCRQGQNWEWDGVRFEFLYPPPGKILKGENGDSCLLKVTVGATPTSPGQRILLTGDLYAREERRMLAEFPASLASDVILVPHHGSRTSSTPPFVAAVNPRWAIASTGYRNRFGHPRSDVVERYVRQGAGFLRTDRDGALILVIAPGHIDIRRWRQEARRYWHFGDTW